MATWELQLVARLFAASILALIQVSRTSGEQIYMHGHSFLQVRQQHGEQRFFGASAPTNTMDIAKLVSGADAPSSISYDTQRTDSLCANVGSVRSWTAGAVAPINETGYRDVASICCRYDMALFIERAVKHEKYEICSAGGLQGVVWWFDCPADGYNHSYADLLVVFAKATTGDCPWLTKSGDSCKRRAGNCPSFPDSKSPQPCTHETTVAFESTTITTSAIATTLSNRISRPVPPQSQPPPVQSVPTTPVPRPVPTTTTTTTTRLQECLLEMYGYRGWKATFPCCDPGKKEKRYRGGKWFREFRRQGAINDDTKRVNVLGHNCEAWVYDGGQFTGWYAVFPEGNYTAREYSNAGAFKGASSVRVVHK